MSNLNLSNDEATSTGPVHLFLDASRGVAGDMLLAAFVNSGVPKEVIQQPLNEILPPHEIQFEPQNRRGIVGLGAQVTPLEASPPHRTLPDLLKTLEHPRLSDWVRNRAQDVYRRLAKAEATVHGIPEDRVHFHEVGAIDAQVDILGVLLAVEYLSPQKITCTSLPLGHGQVRAAHGVIPVPAPAVVELLQGAQVHAGPSGRELTTPTGAALLMSLATTQESAPAGTLLKQGWGYGQRVAADEEPVNGVRLLVLNPQTLLNPQKTSLDSPLQDHVVRMETVIDHITGEDLGGIVDRCLEAGALEAFLSPIQMKKSRPGHQLTVLGKPEDETNLCRTIHRWTGSLGIRIDILRRSLLKRESRKLEAFDESIGLKLAWCGEELISARPEHDDVSRLASTHDWSVDHTRQQLATCIEAYLVDEGLKTPFQRTSPEKSPKFGDSS